jgi:hypothetical protein
MYMRHASLSIVLAFIFISLFFSVADKWESHHNLHKYEETDVISQHETISFSTILSETNQLTLIDLKRLLPTLDLVLSLVIVKPRWLYFEETRTLLEGEGV